MRLRITSVGVPCPRWRLTYHGTPPCVKEAAVPRATKRGRSVVRRTGTEIEIDELDLPGLALVRAKRITDGRGWFREVFNERRLEELGIPTHFVQDNISCSA